ncbi:hypothetical protein HID58_014232 [Brassica napus]|uniref:RRM domain-containing protein n=1 Tax=Brassica napus TaxID=3708 RepID=A0ABQ8DGK2_BRANA|nr:hypothetical protein HID58_014232 [Brassica napus]
MVVPSKKKLKQNIRRRRTSFVFVSEIVEGYNRAKTKKTGEFKGCAHVDFNDSLSVAMAALKLDQYVICGRTVLIVHLLEDAHDQANAKLDQETVNTSTAMLRYDLQKNNGGSYCMNETYTATNEAHIGRLASEACLKKLQNTGHTNAKVDHQTVEARPIQETSYNHQKISGDTDNNGGSYMDET